MHVSAAALPNGGRVFIDEAFFSNNFYVTTTGGVARDTLQSGLVHELGHAVTGLIDNDSFVNFAGDNVTLVNSWFLELGFEQQGAYHAYDTRGLNPKNPLSEGFEYTFGEGVTNVVWDRGFYENSYRGVVSISFDSGNIDLFNNSISGSSLLIGGQNDNIYGGTNNRDFLYGGGGSDTLVGYAGDDYIDGGDGDDILSGGAGRNVIAGGQGNDVYDLRFNGFANGVGLGIQYLAPSGDDDKEALIVASREIGGAATSQDLLLDVEEIRLSDNADHILTRGINLGDYGALTVNAGGFSGEVAGADFDTVSFNTRNNPLLGTEGIFWRNGGTQGALPNLDLANLGASAAQLVALGFVPAVAALLAAPGLRIGALLANLTGASFFLEDNTRFNDDLTVTGIENVNLTDEDDSFAFTARDYSIHSGFGTINAGGGEDVILFRDARYFNAGEYLNSADQLLEDERAAAEARGVEYTGRDPDPDAPIATEILRLTVNGGDGEDRIFIRGGTGAIAAGGAGRDVLYNSSRGGELWGDGLDGLAANGNVAMGREMAA